MPDIHSSFQFDDTIYTTYNDLPLSQSAASLFKGSKKKFFLIGLFFILACILNWHTTFLTVVAIITLLYFIDLFFNLIVIIKSFTSKQPVGMAATQRVFEVDLPKYTIFCPLYKEAAIIPQFIKAMEKLDYPKEKLQILLLLEEDDLATISAAREMNLPSNFEVHIVPNSLPKTKPKACNYGLQYATGTYCVIYDAEDKPEADQLKKVVEAFSCLPENTVCVQAKLNFYNKRQNVLTRLFTTEYTTWFELTLFGLESLQAPIPLGGTSNHFKTAILKAIHGWDAFNVTEDADLGMRLVENGYQTALIDSTTYEEANSDVSNWLSQRSRWIKGYIQTYFVHLKNIFKIPHKKDAFYFQLLIGGKVLSLFINPVMWIICISYFAFRHTFGSFIESFYPAPVLYMAVICIVFGNFLYFYYSMIGLARRKLYGLMWISFLMPVYWLMMSVASWVALYSLIRKPFYWAKTKHGLHLPTDRGEEIIIPMFQPLSYGQ